MTLGYSASGSGSKISEPTESRATGKRFSDQGAESGIDSRQQQARSGGNPQIIVDMAL